MSDHGNSPQATDPISTFQRHDARSSPPPLAQYMRTNVTQTRKELVVCGDQ